MPRWTVWIVRHGLNHSWQLNKTGNGDIGLMYASLYVLISRKLSNRLNAKDGRGKLAQLAHQAKSNACIPLVSNTCTYKIQHHTCNRLKNHNMPFTCCRRRVYRESFAESGVSDRLARSGLKLLEHSVCAANFLYPSKLDGVTPLAGLMEVPLGGFSLETRPFVWTKALDRTWYGSRS